MHRNRLDQTTAQVLLPDGCQGEKSQPSLEGPEGFSQQGHVSEDLTGLLMTRIGGRAMGSVVSRPVRAEIRMGSRVLI